CPLLLHSFPTRRSSDLEGVGYPCPTSEYMGAMNDNQYCTLCTECVKSCPHDNIALNVRSSGADLLHPHRAKIDEAYMAILVFIRSEEHTSELQSRENLV